jgi:hypothetical protein
MPVLRDPSKRVALVAASIGLADPFSSPRCWSSMSSKFLAYQTIVLSPVPLSNPFPFIFLFLIHKYIPVDST